MANYANAVVDSGKFGFLTSPAGVGFGSIRADFLALALRVAPFDVIRAFWVTLFFPLDQNNIGLHPSVGGKDHWAIARALVRENSFGEVDGGVHLVAPAAECIRTVSLTVSFTLYY